MNVLQRHYVSEFLTLFMVISVGLGVVVSLIDLVDKIDELMTERSGAGVLAYYAICGFPGYFVRLMPVAALLGALYTFGLATKSRETVAIMASGGRMKKFLLPFVAIGLLLSVVSFLLFEFVVPSSTRKAMEIRNAMSGRRTSPSLFQDGVLWIRTEEGYLVKIDFYEEETASLRGVTVFVPGERGLKEMIRAGSASYAGNAHAWILREVVIYSLEDGKTRYLPELEYPRMDSPDFFKEEFERSEEMGIVELYRYYRRVKDSGVKNLKLAVDMNSKLSYPLVAFFMTVIGVSFASRRDLGGLKATAYGVLISLGYWFLYTILLSFGYTGIVPPLVAAWLVPFISAVLAVELFRRIPE